MTKAQEIISEAQKKFFESYRAWAQTERECRKAPLKLIRDAYEETHLIISATNIIESDILIAQKERIDHLNSKK